MPQVKVTRLVLFFCRDNGPLPYGNIMFDRRIVRGSNYAQHPMPVSARFVTPKYTLYSTVPNTDTTKIHNSMIRNLETRGREYSRTGIAVYQFIFYNQITLGGPPSDAKTPCSSRNTLSFVEPGAL